jgi:uncharacterized membrane protein
MLPGILRLYKINLQKNSFFSLTYLREKVGYATSHKKRQDKKVGLILIIGIITSFHVLR